MELIWLRILITLYQSIEKDTIPLVIKVRPGIVGISGNIAFQQMPGITTGMTKDTIVTTLTKVQFLGLAKWQTPALLDTNRSILMLMELTLTLSYVRVIILIEMTTLFRRHCLGHWPDSFNVDHATLQHKTWIWNISLILVDVSCLPCEACDSVDKWSCSFWQMSG